MAEEKEIFMEEELEDTKDEVGEEITSDTTEEKPSEEDVKNVDDIEDNSEDDSAIQLSNKDKELKDYINRLQHTMAEFDNYRKRTIKEKAAMFENGVKEAIEKMLPVIDNFERALENCPEDDKSSGFAQGVEMIYKQLKEVLLDIGVEEIEALGVEFNPNYHHAVTHAEDKDLDDNMVAEVFQKGYIYNESVIRHSMVKVVN